MCSVWPERQPDRKLRWVTSLCTGPNLNCLQMGGSPQVSIGPHLWSDQEKVTVLPPSEEASSCFELPSFVESTGGRQSQEWDAAETTFS